MVEFLSDYYRFVKKNHKKGSHLSGLTKMAAGDFLQGFFCIFKHKLRIVHKSYFLVSLPNWLFKKNEFFNKNNILNSSSKVHNYQQKVFLRNNNLG